MTSKHRELEGLKLVRKEISERELKQKVEIVETECESYRSQAFRLMQKYPSNNEQEGIDEEDNHEYRFNNLVLAEYDALLNELVQTLEKVETHKKKREVIISNVRMKKTLVTKGLSDSKRKPINRLCCLEIKRKKLKDWKKTKK